MNKSLLLVAVATFATSGAFAQRAASVINYPVQKTMAVEAEEYSAQESCIMSVGADKVQKAEEENKVKAWYHRPAGTFYLSSYTTEGKASYSTWYAPYLMLRPYADYSFNGVSTNTTQQNWKVWYQDEMKDKTQEFTGAGFKASWGIELDTIPRLTAIGTNNQESVYQLGGFNGATAYTSMLSTYPSYPAQIKPSTTVVRHAWASPKFFAAKSNRDGTVKAGAYYHTIKAEDGTSLGNLLGRNTAGVDAMAIAVEKPTHPYAVNAIGVRFQSLKMASADAQATLVANIYKVAEIPSYKAPYVTITPGEKIATTSVKVSDFYLLNTPELNRNASTGKYSGILYFPLETPLNVDDAIMVEITGYNVDALDAGFTSLYSADYYEEGYGEIGYVKKDGKYVSMRGGFINEARSTAPAILLEVEMPFLTWNYSDEIGEGLFAAAGESKKIEVFTYRQAAEMKIKLDEEGKTPAWLTATVEDDLSTGEFGFLSYLNMKAEPLPVGVNYREATVTVSYPGAVLTYTAKQGAEPTGINDVNVADANKARKVIENGQIYIMVGDKKYNIMGVEVK